MNFKNYIPILFHSELYHVRSCTILYIFEYFCIYLHYLYFTDICLCTFAFSNSNFLSILIIPYLLSRYLSILYKNFSFCPKGLTAIFCRTSDIMSLMRLLTYPKTSCLISYEEIHFTLHKICRRVMLSSRFKHLNDELLDLSSFFDSNGISSINLTKLFNTT